MEHGLRSACHRAAQVPVPAASGDRDVKDLDAFFARIKAANAQSRAIFDLALEPVRIVFKVLPKLLCHVLGGAAA
jgi:hypothetical protein